MAQDDIGERVAKVEGELSGLKELIIPSLKSIDDKQDMVLGKIAEIRITEVSMRTTIDSQGQMIVEDRIKYQKRREEDKAERKEYRDKLELRIEKMTTDVVDNTTFRRVVIGLGGGTLGGTIMALAKAFELI